MATILLQAAGTFLGGVFGPVGAAIGSAVGAMAGYAVDQTVLGGTRRVEGSRLNTSRPFQAEEGVPIRRVYGTARLGGDMIWATRFEERKRTTRQGGKGGSTTTTTYSYFCNAAFALCEGEIAMVRRIWADGRELDLNQVNIRIHNGSEDQPVDPLIGAKQGAGNAPAYRGIAYAVIERFPLTDYGNRVPQFQFEVIRTTGAAPGLIRAMTLIPGSTEYGLFDRPVTRSTTRGVTEQVNRHVLHGSTDLTASLDELIALCPGLEDVALVVTWFGDDLRIGQCRLRPGVASVNGAGYSVAWQAAGLTRTSARFVSRIAGAAAYGGTPADQSVIQAIRHLRGRGVRVTLHPFIMMDVAPGNSLPDPWGGEAQPAFPWRGRLTCHPAPGLDATADKTAAARTQISAFAGTARPSHFSLSGSNVVFSGSSTDWRYRRFILHHAFLARAAGGVDAFMIGSELRGVTSLRDGTGAFPFVEELCALAGEVKAVLGAGTAVTYGADWTEYFGHQPADGSGDVLFHLDALWAHEAVAAVGINNYMPLSDWRDADYAGGNPDGFAGPYDAAGLRGRIAAGEGFDWYYASAADRGARLRTPITDGAYAKPWVFRNKDIASWWANAHHDRIGGVEQPEPTPWIAASKPIWFTELGCPAVDKGPNQPNVFADPKSFENALPYYSGGGRSDLGQRRFIEAHLHHWSPQSPHFDPEANPVSPVYGGRMVDASRIWLWAWDARPFPAFPQRSDLWTDADNWLRGHWLNGRLSTTTVADLIETILREHGLAGDAGGVGATVAGYVVEGSSTARAALEPIVDLFGIAVHEEAGRLVFTDEAAPRGQVIAPQEFVAEEGQPVLEYVRAPDEDLPDNAELTYLDPFCGHRPAVARAVQPGASRPGAAETLSFPGSIEQDAAEAFVGDWLERGWSGRETVSLALAPTAAEVVPGSLIRLPGGGEYLVTETEAGLSLNVAGRRILRRPPRPWQARTPAPDLASEPAIAGVPLVEFLDLPMTAQARTPEGQFRIAVFARPWRSQAVFASPTLTGFSQRALVSVPATIGELTQALPAGFEGRFDSRGLEVTLLNGELSGVEAIHVLNGANMAAVRSASGAWEVLQFVHASETAPGAWRLEGLLRGQYGTTDAMRAGAEAGAYFVLLDEDVVEAGLTSAQVGLLLNWRVGAAGLEISEDHYASHSQAGGVRALLPLSPVHLRGRRLAGGGLGLSWVRRGRLDADRWDGEDIPLGEDAERYRVEIRAAADGEILRTAETGQPGWDYPQAAILADFGAPPGTIHVRVAQIGIQAGAGVPAQVVLALG